MKFSITKRPLQSHSSEVSMLARVIDTFCIGILFYLWPEFLHFESSDWIIVVLISMLIFLISSQSVGLYRSWRSEGFIRQVAPVFSAVGLTGVGLLLLNYLFKLTEVYSRDVFFLWLFSAPVLILIWRGLFSLLLIFLRKQGLNVRRVAILGATAQGAELASIMLSDPTLGLRLIGIFDDRRKQGNQVPPWHPEISLKNSSEMRIQNNLPVHLSGNFSDLLVLACNGDIDTIYITLPMRAEERTLFFLSKLSDTTASVYVVPDFFIFDLLHARIGHLGRLTTLSVFETPFIGLNGFIKRFEDIVASLIILFFISFPMLIIALVIKLTSPGPVIFKQYRHGLDGRSIQVWKFRSMTVMDNGNDVKQAKKGDTRITKVGFFLRRTSLDELPQFLNVLGGSMSIVGPRPHAVSHNEQYRKLVPGYMLRHKIKPGITGWAQVNGWRGETDTLDKMEQRIKYDLDYIRNWSLLLDIKIIIITLFKGFVHKNAY